MLPGSPRKTLTFYQGHKHLAHQKTFSRLKERGKHADNAPSKTGPDNLHKRLQDTDRVSHFYLYYYPVDSTAVIDCLGFDLRRER